MSTQRESRFQNMSGLLKPTHRPNEGEQRIAAEASPRRDPEPRKRPTKPATTGDQTARSISFTMPPALRNQFRRQAKEAGLSQSDYFLRVIEETIDRIIDPQSATSRPNSVFHGLAPTRDRDPEGEHVVLTVRISVTDQKILNDIITASGIQNRSRYVRLAFAEYFRERSQTEENARVR